MTVTATSEAKHTTGNVPCLVSSFCFRRTVLSGDTRSHQIPKAKTYSFVSFNGHFSVSQNHTKGKEISSQDFLLRCDKQCEKYQFFQSAII
jgi:hypothetical protein